MDKSRIIRSIVAVVVSLISVILMILCIKGLNETQAKISIYIKLIYVVICIASIWLYSYVKKKLIKKVLNKNLMYVYRYAYLAAIVFISRLVMSYTNSLPFCGRMGAEIVITFLNVIIIKKIVFNISTSDMLSAIASLIYIFIPQVLFVKEMLNEVNFNVTFILAAVYILLKIIDEVSQKSLKSKKYIYMTLVFTLFIILNMFSGGMGVIWIGIVGLTLLSSKNIDFTHMNFGQRIIDKVKSIKFKRLLYRIERININKLFIVFGITTLVVTVFGILKIVLLDVEFNTHFTLSYILTNLNGVLRYSRSYYLLLLLVGIIAEVIGYILRRKVDIKTTVLRGVYLTVVFSLLISSYTIYVSQVFNILVILNCLLNIGNIYYNRDEKIKLLKDKN